MVGPLELLVRLLFGHDIFVSYSRADGATYAAGLAGELARLGFRCRLDQWGSDPNPALPPSLRRDVRRSALFVLVGSDGAGRSANVEEEIAEFLKTGRSIIPIDVAGAVERAQWARLVAGLARTAESPQALATGVPAAAVVARIEKGFTFRRRDQRLQLIAWTIAAIVAALIGTATIAGVRTRRMTQEARRAAALADEQRQIAVALRLANQAELIFSQQPTELPLAALLAVQSLRRLPSVEGQQALARALGPLPQKIASLPHGDGENGDVEQIRFSADGKRLVTSNGWAAIVWDGASGKQLRRVEHEESGRSTAIHAAALNASGARLATAGEDGTARIWPLAGGEPVKLAVGARVDDVQFNPARDQLATAAANGVALWDLSGRRTATLSSEPNARRVLFSADGRFVASMYKDKRLASDVAILVHATDGGAPVVTIVHPWRATPKSGPALGNYRVAFDFSADGKAVANANVDGSVRVWKIPGGEEVWRRDAPHAVYGLRLASDGRKIAVADGEPDAHVWEIPGGRELARLPHGGRAYFLDLSADGRYVATGGDDRLVRVWSLPDGIELQRFAHGANPQRPAYVIPLAAFSPDGARIVTANTDTAFLWRVGADPFAIESFHTQYPIAHAALSPNGKLVASIPNGRVLWDRKARIWSVGTRGEVDLPHLHLAASVRFSPDGRFVMTTDDDPAIVSGAEATNFTAIVWNPISGARVSAHQHGQHVLSTAFSPNGELAATSSEDGEVAVWRTRDGSVVSKKISPKPRRVASVDDSGQVSLVEPEPCGAAKDGDGEEDDRRESARSLRYVADADAANVVTVKNAAGCGVVARVSLPARPGALAFSPDERYLVTITNEDHLVRVWEAQSGREIARRLSSAAKLRDQIAFSADGSAIATITNGNPDDVVELWRFRPEDAMREACRRVSRELSDDEWRLYLSGEPRTGTCP